MKKFRENSIALLVGDNPFHNISHLSQERTWIRGNTTCNPEIAAQLISTSLENGANGFMFSVSETTLSILEVLRKKGEIERLDLYPIVPYASEYVKLSTQVGGIPGLVKRFASQILTSGNLKAIALGLTGIVRTDPVSLMKTYLSYELGRIKHSASKTAKIRSMILHEVITDMALALNLDWFFKSYVDFISSIGMSPGFNTCNFAYLVDKFDNWNIDLRHLTIASPFNQIGFQMFPSKAKCEEALQNLSEPVLIAISILAAGYLSPSKAIEYVATLPNIKGVAIGVSKESQARETFRLVQSKLERN